MNNIHIHRRLLIWLLSLLLVVGVAVGLWMISRQPKTDIRTHNTEVQDFSKGNITQGNNVGDTKELKTAQSLVYESPVDRTESPSTNAVGIRWKQYGSEDGAHLQVRVNDGSRWTDWVDVDSDGAKDGTPQEDHAGLVLTKDAKQVQYRFSLNGNGQEVRVTKPQLVYIDSTRGPDPTKARGLAKLFGKSARAGAEGPRIYSRAEWGNPQPNSSPGWTPNYWNPLRRVIVHHTVTAGSTTDAAAEIRGIWQFHTYSNGWGDIGYNYLVDKLGNIYQGRYYNQADANIYGEVEGGHAYGFNDYSVGIATLGDFQTQGGTTPMVYGVSQIAAWKMYKYNIQANQQYSDEGVPSTTPEGSPPRGPRTQFRVAGHRDYLSTACPGNNMYVNLGNIRSITDSYIAGLVNWDRWDYSFQGEGVNGSPGGSLSLKTGQSTTVYLDLKNEGTQTWDSSVKLGTSNPNDRASGFRHSSWESANRVGTFAGKMVSGSLQASSTIAPGETARWQFTVQNQGADSGTYKEYFQPVKEGETWFVRPGGIHWLMSSVGDIYSYQWMGQTYNVPDEPAETGTISLDLKNTGNVNWSNSGANPIRVAPNRPNDRTSAIYDSSWISQNRAATYAGQVNAGTLDSGDGTIEPGNTARFTFTIKAPSFRYVAKEYFNLVAEGKAWMADSAGIHVPMNIAQNYHALIVGQSASPTVDKSSGGISSIYFDYKNTGTYSWKKTDNIVRLGTANPLDRTSLFRANGLTGGQLPTNTANWLSANRIGSFAGQVNSGTLDTADATIEPNSIGRFYVALDGRSVPNGNYNEYFRLVADGFSWLEDYGVFLPVTVQD